MNMQQKARSSVVVMMLMLMLMLQLQSPFLGLSRNDTSKQDTL